VASCRCAIGSGGGLGWRLVEPIVARADLPRPVIETTSGSFHGSEGELLIWRVAARPDERIATTIRAHGVDATPLVL
jgi:hypothetical protein